ncbi:hypothetical protein ACOMHN_027833 [Nucella lapillus]
MNQSLTKFRAEKEVTGEEEEERAGGQMSSPDSAKLTLHQKGQLRLKPANLVALTNNRNSPQTSSWFVVSPLLPFPLSSLLGNDVPVTDHRVRPQPAASPLKMIGPDTTLQGGSGREEEKMFSTNWNCRKDVRRYGVRRRKTEERKGSGVHGAVLSQWLLMSPLLTTGLLQFISGAKGPRGTNNHHSNRFVKEAMEVMSLGSGARCPAVPPVDSV